MRVGMRFGSESGRRALARSLRHGPWRMVSRYLAGAAIAALGLLAPLPLQAQPDTVSILERNEVLERAAPFGRAFRADDERLRNPRATPGALPPVDAFLADASTAQPTLSPDGRYLAVVETEGQRKYVAKYRLTADGLTRLHNLDVTNMAVRGLHWATPDRLLARLQRRDPVTRRSVVVAPNRSSLEIYPAHVVASDADGSDMIVLLDGIEEIDSAFDRSTIVHMLPDAPRHVLLAARDTTGLRTGLVVYRVDIHTGAAQLVERGRDETRAFLADPSGAIRLRTDDAPDGDLTLHARLTPGGPWREIARFLPGRIPDLFPVAFDRNPGTLIALAPRFGDRMALTPFDLAARRLDAPVFLHPEYDVSHAILDPFNQSLIGAEFIADAVRQSFFDPALEQWNTDLQALAETDGAARIVSKTQDDRLMVVQTVGPSDFGTYILVDTQTADLQLIGKRIEHIAPDYLGTTVAFDVATRDGLTLRAYLTLPPGHETGSAPPLVVLPHGGPERRDALGWSAWVQFLASRGYAVLQPNFRGSSGYGRIFAQLGHGEWGRAMQGDITDSVRHVIEAGLADARRVCIVGASYGGYAALAGAAFTPELYRCAISVNGVSDLTAMLDSKRVHAKSYAYWSRSIGDPYQNEQRLYDASPINAAEAVRAPVLLIASEYDTTVLPRQSIRMAGALREAGKSVTYREIRDEGHSFASIGARREVLLAIEAFLARHMAE